MFKAIAQLVARMTPDKIMCNKESVIEWQLEKAVEYGYMLAMSQMNKIYEDSKLYW